MTTQTNKIEWREVKIEEITACLDSKRFPINDEERNKIKGDIPYYGANGQVDLINKFAFDEELLLVAEDGGSWGKGETCAYIIKGKSWVNNHAHVLRIKKDKTNIQYLMHWLNMENLSKYISGTTRGKLNQKAMNNISLPLPFKDGKPDLKEQERIVKILEKAEKLKEKGKKAEDLLNGYLKSVFNEMFYNKGFKEKTLEELTAFIDYRGKTPKKMSEGIPLITAKNVKEGYISIEPREFIAEKDYITWMRRGFPKEGDILFTTEAPLGNVARLGKFDKIALAQRIITFQCSKGLNSYYLLYALLSERVKKKIGIQSTGSTVTGIRSKELKKIEIPLPPLPLQQKFAKIVEQVEKMKENIRKTRQNSEELFNSLMQKAFRGEL